MKTATYLIIFATLCIGPGCKKENSTNVHPTTGTGAATQYTHLAAGTYTWKHKHYNDWSTGALVDSTINDTTLTVTFVNAATLVFAGDTFTYTASISSGSIIGYTYESLPYQAAYGNGSLFFNYTTDSIGINIYTLPGPGQELQWYDDYNTL
jgi:hypothetical protein